jgi:purine-binding chemotaxis protein CheW
MSNLHVVSEPRASSGKPDELQYLTLTIAGQLLGIPVLLVHDVLGPQRITRIPLAPVAVLGSLNLRGRIVTAIDVRRRLGLPERAAGSSSMSVVVEDCGELYSLVVDNVGEVLSLSASELAAPPVTLAALWRSVSRGIHRMRDQLLVVLDITQLLAGVSEEARPIGSLPTAA